MIAESGTAEFLDLCAGDDDLDPLEIVLELVRGDIAGIEVRIHITFFLFLAWIGFTYYQVGGSAAAIDGVLRVLYSGNLGMAHETETICGAMEALKDDDRFQFTFAGGGSRRAEVEEFCRSRELRNVTFTYPGASGDVTVHICPQAYSFDYTGERRAVLVTLATSGPGITQTKNSTRSRA